ncbi:MAG: hypothetical protein AB8E15_11630 [Bdellovibrionales bacterium]
MKSLIVLLLLSSFATVSFGSWTFVPEKGLLASDSQKSGKLQIIYISNFVIDSSFTPFTFAVIADEDLNIAGSSIDAEFVFKSRGKIKARYKRVLKKGKDLNQDNTEDLFLPHRTDSNTSNYQELVEGMIKFGTLDLKIDGRTYPISLKGFTDSFNRFFILSSNPAYVKDASRLNPVEKKSAQCSGLVDYITPIYAASNEGKTVADFESEARKVMMDKANDLNSDQLKALRQQFDIYISDIKAVYSGEIPKKPYKQMVGAYIDCMYQK